MYKLNKTAWEPKICRLHHLWGKPLMSNLKTLHSVIRIPSCCENLLQTKDSRVEGSLQPHWLLRTRLKWRLVNMCSAVNITTGFQALAVIDFFFDLLAAQGMGKICNALVGYILKYSLSFFYLLNLDTKMDERHFVSWYPGCDVLGNWNSAMWRVILTRIHNSHITSQSNTICVKRDWFLTQGQILWIACIAHPCQQLKMYRNKSAKLGRFWE